MPPDQNPFPNDADRHFLWEMLVRRDIAAFMAQDWDMVDGDFDKQRFLGVDARKSPNPQDWKIAFPKLELYRDEWLRQARETANTKYAEDLNAAVYRATRLDEIEIQGNVALLRKKFNGTIKRADGGEDRLLWQTLYYCRNDGDRWRITGFTGYLPYTPG